jgi:hypothetical protein
MVPTDLPASGESLIVSTILASIRSEVDQSNTELTLIVTTHSPASVGTLIEATLERGASTVWRVTDRINRLANIRRDGGSHRLESH